VRELVKQLADIKERVMVNTALLHEVVRRQKSSDNIKLCTKPDSIQLPLKNYDALLVLEQQLKSQEFFKQMVFTLNKLKYVTFTFGVLLSCVQCLLI
jgi:hypothetical protein